MRQIKAGPTGIFTPETQLDHYRIPVDILRASLEIIPRDKTIVDIGCGPGNLLNVLRKHGYSAWGLEGTPGIERRVKNVFEVDLTVPLTSEQARRFAADWGFCFEVGEHIPVKFFDRFLYNIDLLVKEYLMMIWGDRLGPNYSRRRERRRFGHVNCKSQVYIASAFTRYGWDVDEDLTQKVRGFLTKARFNRQQRLMVLSKPKKHVNLR